MKNVEKQIRRGGGKKECLHSRALSQHMQTQAGEAHQVFILPSVVGTLLQTYCQNFLEAMAKATDDNR